MKKVLIVVAAVLACLAVYKLVLTSAGSDEDQVRGILSGAVEAAEGRNLKKLSGWLHEDFRAAEGPYNRNEVLDIVGKTFLAFHVIRVEMQGLEIQMVDETTARATFVATIRASLNARSSEQDLTSYRGGDRFSLTFKKTGGKWLLLSSEAVKSTAN